MDTKYFYVLFVLGFVHHSLGSPIEYDVIEGRGIGSTLWGWISYPFSWWSSESSDQPPVTEQLVSSTTLGPYDSIEVGKRNVTVWCNDQTCTTMKCDSSGCKNNTCNIYDTDLSGECREFNNEIKPEEPITTKPIEPTSTTLPEKTTESSSAKPMEVSTIQTTTPKAISQEQPITDEKPLELEAVLSLSITEPTDKQEESGQ